MKAGRVRDIVDAIDTIPLMSCLAPTTPERAPPGEQLCYGYGLLWYSPPLFLFQELGFTWMLCRGEMVGDCLCR